MSDYVTHLESALDGTVLPAGTVQTTHAGRPLWVRYDLEAIGRAVDRDALAARPADMWRWRELLPVGDGDILVSLGEAQTPLLPCPRLAAELGVAELLVKDESRLPTGSFKARGMAVAVTMAKRLGLRRLAIPTAGNAGGALAAYAARAGLEAFVFMPADTPSVNRAEAVLYGAHAFAVDGLIHHCGAVVRAGVDELGWFDCSTLKEPYRLEGKKIMGLELAAQLHWRLPDVIVYPTGGGTGLIGMAKAFDELDALGWLDDPARPRLFACQAEGCAPIVEAFRRGERFAEPVEHPVTCASGLRVPAAVGDFMILDAIAATGGQARSAAESEIRPWMARAGALEGLALCPEAAVGLAAAASARSEGAIGPGDRVVLFNTGAAQKSLEVLSADLPAVAREAVDWGMIRSRAASAD